MNDNVSLKKASTFLIFLKNFHVFHVYSFFTHFPVFRTLDHCWCKCYYQSTNTKIIDCG